MKLKMKQFYRFCQHRYKIKMFAGQMRDGRKKPQISAATIFLVLVMMVAWRKRHFLEMDQFARKAAVKRFFRCQKRAMVCSDSTIARSLAGLEVKPVRKMLGQLYQSQPIQGVLVKVGQERLRLGAIDGTQMGYFLASVILILGAEVDLFLDAEPMEKQGKELPTSQQLLQRCLQR